MGITPHTPIQNRTCAINAYGFSPYIHTLSIKQTYLDSWFWQWKCPQQAIKESILRVTSSLTSPIKPLIQQPFCLHEEVLHLPRIASPLASRFCLANLPNSKIFVFSSASSSPYFLKRSSSLCLNIPASYLF